MAENKKSFILYADYINLFEQLTDDEAGKLAKHLFRYVNDKNPVLEDRLLKLTFEPIKQQLKRDLKVWENSKSKKSESGRLGNLKRWNNDLYLKVMKEEISLEDAENEAVNRKTSQCDISDRTVSHPIANVAVTVTDTVTDTVNESVKKEEVFRAPDLSKSNLFREPVIPTKNEVLESFIQQGGTNEMAKSFWERSEATGWYLKGSPITNFRNLVYSFVTNWNKNESKVVQFEKTGPPLKTADQL
ncbi:MAG: DUF6291 domain-containing protein [Ginsengibacter sp.]